MLAIHLIYDSIKCRKRFQLLRKYNTIPNRLNSFTDKNMKSPKTKIITSVASRIITHSILLGAPIIPFSTVYGTNYESTLQRTSLDLNAPFDARTSPCYQLPESRQQFTEAEARERAQYHSEQFAATCQLLSEVSGHWAHLEVITQGLHIASIIEWAWQVNTAAAFRLQNNMSIDYRIPNTAHNEGLLAVAKLNRLTAEWRERLEPRPVPHGAGTGLGSSSPPPPPRSDTAPADRAGRRSAQTPPLRAPAADAREGRRAARTTAIGDSTSPRVGRGGSRSARPN
jgi:hypothetical protein